MGSKKRRENIPEYFKHNGRIVTGSLEIAEGCNTLFAGIGPELAESIGHSQTNFIDFLGPALEETFVFAQMSPEVLMDIAKDLKPKCSTGPDGISSKLLKIILPIIIKPVCHLFNLSVQTGYIPIQLKTAKIIPVFKSGDAHLFTNYRPISLLPSLSKLL